MHRKGIVFLLVLALSAVAVLPGAAAPLYDASSRDFLAAPCAFGAAYDPACDVDHDGDVDIFDIQLSAGHWNQTGVWTGGDSWSLTGNAGTNPAANFLGTTDGQPLAIQAAGGNTGIGTSTPNARFNVVGTSWFQGDSTPLPATAGKGIAIGFSGEQGYIYGFDYGTWTQKDLMLQHAGGKVIIGSATPGPGRVSIAASVSEHGLYVSSAGQDGVNVDWAGHDGVKVNSAGVDGVYVNSALDDGVVVGSAGDEGVIVYQAGTVGLRVWAANTGIDTTGTAWAGYFHGDIGVEGNCYGCLQANFALNAGDRVLQPGDAVSVQDVTPTDLDNAPALWQVTLAQPGQAVAGVVSGRAELDVQEEHRPTETGRRLVPREGAAQPGEYVTVVYSGPMQVQVAPGESAIEAGTRLTAATDGALRPLQTRTVDGMVVSEGAPVLGVALESLEAGDGLIWVLVAVQ